MWPTLFSLTNGLAMIAWIILAFLPRKPITRTLVMYLGVGLLCLTYAVLLVAVVSGGIDQVQASGAGSGKPGISTIEGVRAIFGSDGGVVIGWTHYLAFDLFTGLWIANDADHKGFSRIVQVPFLFATFMVGPVGLLLWLVLREGRARAAARG